MKSRMLSVLSLLALCAGLSAPSLAQGLPGADVRPGTAAPPARDAMKGRMQERCRDNPQQCEEIKAKRHERREQCRANPGQCREEKKARRDERCKANPQRCEEMKARLRERQEQCKANPDKCGPGRALRPDGK